jgi:hypothetical protein
MGVLLTYKKHPLSIKLRNRLANQQFTKRFLGFLRKQTPSVF